MRKEFEKKLKTNINILKGIGILEIIGGITGIGLIIWLTLQGMETNTYVFLILLVAIAFYIYSIYAGIKLFKYQEKGILHSQILQFIQLISFSIGGTTYLLTSGGNLFIGYNMTEGNLEFKLNIIASEFQLNLMSSEVSNYVYINILAIIVLYLIDKSTKTIIEQQNIKLNYEKNLIENLGSE